jgi:hypothetical protein
MKNKDQILLEQAYSNVLENKYEQNVFHKIDYKAQNDDRNAGLEDEDNRPFFKERKLGDEFTDRKGIRRIMIRMQDGKLIPVEKVFIGKKDGIKRERYKRPDGTIGVQRVVEKPKPEPKPNPFRTEWGSPNANPEWD